MSDGLKLPARLDLSAAMQLASDLRAIDGDMRVDASDVNHMGALCLQALIAAARKAQANGKTFELTGVSEKVSEQMNVMGVTPQAMMEGAL